SDAIAEAPADEVEIQPRIADELLVQPNIVAVGVEAVELDAAAGVITAHLGADIVGERQFGAARHIAVAIAVALDPAERLGVRRNAVGRESLAAEAPAQRSGAPPDRGARADRLARPRLEVEAAFEGLF